MGELMPGQAGQTPDNHHLSGDTLTRTDRTYTFRYVRMSGVRPEGRLRQKPPRLRGGLLHNIAHQVMHDASRRRVVGVVARDKVFSVVGHHRHAAIGTECPTPSKGLSIACTMHGHRPFTVAHSAPLAGSPLNPTTPRPHAPQRTDAPHRSSRRPCDAMPFRDRIREAVPCAREARSICAYSQFQKPHFCVGGVAR